jgi:hypothetical protein
MSMKSRHAAALALVGWYLRGIMLTASVLLALSQWCLGVYFAAKAPSVPNPTEGVVYPSQIHESVVYLTRTESDFYNDRIVDISFYLGAPVVAYLFFARMKESKRQDGDGTKE